MQYIAKRFMKRTVSQSKEYSAVRNASQLGNETATAITTNTNARHIVYIYSIDATVSITKMTKHMDTPFAASLENSTRP